MKTQKFTYLLLAIFFSFHSFSQLKVNSYGKALVGPVPTMGWDQYYLRETSNSSTMQLFGGKDGACSGAKLGFGDMLGPHSTKGSGLEEALVFIGEYTNNYVNGKIDTDQLWLHGDNGIYLTRGRNLFPIAYYDFNYGDNTFYFECEIGGLYSIYGQQFYQWSDEKFKTNIKKIDKSLSLLKQLTGVTYDMDEHAVAQKKGNNSSENAKNSKNSEQKTNQNKKHIGFIAQDIQKIFPDLVMQDKDGDLAVDYISLIPVIIEGMKEQNLTIEAQSLKIKELEALMNSGGKTISDISLKSVEETIAIEYIAKDETINAFLYQNVPNPFSEETEIRYFLPQDTKQANICIFDM